MPLTWVFVVGGFLVLFGVQLVVEFRPEGRFASALQPRLFAGLYLDEFFTRIAFRIWRPTFRPSEEGDACSRLESTIEVP